MGIIFGGIRFPLVGGSANALAESDPWLNVAIPYWAACLNYYVGDAVKAAYPGRAGSAVVATSNVDPEPFLATAVQKAPLLAVWCEGGTQSRITMQRDHVTARYKLAWILPGTTKDQAERVFPLLYAAFVLLVGVTERQADDIYNAGERVWATAGSEDVVWGDYEIGFFEDPNAQGHLMPALQATVAVRVEDEYDSTGAETLAGQTASIGIGDDVEGILDDAIVGKSDVPVT